MKKILRNPWLILISIILLIIIAIAAIFFIKNLLSYRGFSEWDGTSRYLPVDTGKWATVNNFSIQATQNANKLLQPYGDSVGKSRGYFNNE